jgi:hypothetical protein
MMSLKENNLKFKLKSANLVKNNRFKLELQKRHLFYFILLKENKVKEKIPWSVLEKYKI